MSSDKRGARVNGARMIGGWRVSSRLGQGGNGEVFRAEKETLVGAIKLLASGAPKRVARFRDEVTAMRRCADTVRRFGWDVDRRLAPDPGRLQADVGILGRDRHDASTLHREKPCSVCPSEDVS